MRRQNATPSLKTAEDTLLRLRICHLTCSVLIKAADIEHSAQLQDLFNNMMQLLSHTRPALEMTGVIDDDTS